MPRAVRDVEDVGARVDEVDLALEDDDARTCRAGPCPSRRPRRCARRRSSRGGCRWESSAYGGLVGLAGAQVQVDLDRLAAAARSRRRLSACALHDRRPPRSSTGPGRRTRKSSSSSACADLAEGEAQLDAHDLRGRPARDARGHRSPPRRRGRSCRGRCSGSGPRPGWRRPMSMGLRPVLFGWPGMIMPWR